MLRVGLTGGIGSGKTTVADHFCRLGIDIIDADEIVHKISTPGNQAFDQIEQVFGDEILNNDGSINRQKLRETVFSDKNRRRQLEAILHPAVRAAMQHAITDVKSPYCILVIPLLVETGFDNLVDRVLVVTAEHNKRIEWIKKRSALTTEQIESIMTAQASDEQRRKIADDIIENTGSLDSLHDQVEILDQKYRKLAKENM